MVATANYEDPITGMTYVIEVKGRFCRETGVFHGEIIIPAFTPDRQITVRIRDFRERYT
jgi:hypothetical protein